MIYSDLELYNLIKDYCFEFHNDGIFIVKSYDIGEFATKLGIKDCEYYVPCFIVSNGDFGIDAHNLECFCDDIDSVINALIQEIGEK